MTLPFDQAVDIGHGRGRLALEAAQSLWRVDVAMRSAFGRAADINEAWRSPEQANANYARYRAYLRDPRNNPWAPIALPADQSVHCVGFAVDTDDTSAEQMRIWNDHGWYWTVYRDGKLIERWHLEYFRDRDNHRNDPTPNPEEEDMPTPREIANELLNYPAFDDGPTVSEMLKRTNEVYNAMFEGGPSMQDAGRSVSASLANLTEFAARVDGRVLGVHQAVFEGGTDMPDAGKSIGQSLADLQAKP